MMTYFLVAMLGLASIALCVDFGWPRTVPPRSNRERTLMILLGFALFMLGQLGLQGLL